MDFLIGVQSFVDAEGEIQKQAYIYPSGGRKMRGTCPKTLGQEAGVQE